MAREVPAKSHIVQDPTPRAFLARQPILDRDLQTRGYELFYRQHAPEGEADSDPIRATSTLLAHLLVEFGVERVVGRHRAWVSFPGDYLLAKEPIPVPPSALVVQLLPGFEPNARLTLRLRKLAESGYRIALDNFDYRPDLEPYLVLAHFVKVEVRGKSKEELAAEVERLASFGVEVVAESIDTMAEFEVCKSVGFDWFQGYFVTNPELTSEKTPANRIALVQLLAEMHALEPDLRRVESLVTQDVALSFQLLRFLNSSLYALPRKVESIQHAVMLIGIARLRNLVSLLLVNQITDRPAALIETSLVRAKTVETLADAAGLVPESGFTVGLLSVLDAMLNQPMEKVLEQVPLSDDLHSALTRREGPYGRLLKAKEAHEQADHEAIVAEGTDPMAMTLAWLDAVGWARGVHATLKE